MFVIKVQTTPFRVTDVIATLQTPTIKQSEKGPALNNPEVDIDQKFDAYAELFKLVVVNVHAVGLYPHVLDVSTVSW